MKVSTCIILSLIFGSLLPVSAQEWQHYSTGEEFYRPIIKERNFPISAKIFKLGKWPDVHSETKVTLPLPGNEEPMSFEMEVAPVLSKDLQEKYPFIRSYTIKNEQTSGILTLGREALDAVFFVRGKKVVVEQLNERDYIVFYDRKVSKESDRQEISLGHCLTHQGVDKSEDSPISSVNIRRAEQTSLKVYDLAISTTDTYAQRNGGTVASVLEQVNRVFGRVNLVFQREIGVKFEIMAESEELIYLEDDPYREGNNSSMLSSVGDLFNDVIGFENYDLGHLLATDCGSGTAGVSSGIGTVCNTNKGRALSCDLTRNLSEYVRVLTHELGHQLGAQHTWSNCPSVNTTQRSNSTAFEPGSGSTIMSYIGACGPENLTTVSGPLYFHGGSLDEMNNYILSGQGNSCVALVEKGNSVPEISFVPVDNLSIPIKTPFFLTAEAFDEDGDQLYYTWEQYNLGPISPLGEPIQSAPSFRSFPPDTSAIRYFPQWNTLLSNDESDEEVLPTYSRNLDFGITVRDNNEESGGTAREDISIHATSNAGPFFLDFPNSTADELYAGDFVTVQWEVANTNIAPVSASHVLIKMSTDGGYTYPYILNEKTENDGEENVQVPNIVSDSVRFMIQGFEHIFYDVSDENISVQNPSSPTFGINISPGTQIVCLPDEPQVKLNPFPVLGFSDSVTFSITNQYDDIGIDLSKKTILVGQEMVIDFDIDPGFQSDTVEFTVKAKAPSLDTLYRTVRMIVINNQYDDLELEVPMDGAQQVNVLPSFEWDGSVNADYYTIQVSPSPEFPENNLAISETSISADSFPSTSQLDQGTVYFWRILPHNSCGVDSSLAVQAFQTALYDCREFTPEGLPSGVGGSDTGSIISQIEVSENFQIDDINVRNIMGFHESVNQIQMTLEKDSMSVFLYKGECGVRNLNLDISFDDEAVSKTDCRLSSGTLVKPYRPLAPLYTLESEGIWTFRIRDSIVGAGGVLQSWQLQLCGINEAEELAYKVDTIRVSPGGMEILSENELVFENLEELEFQLVSQPGKGVLSLGGQVITTGQTWTGMEVLSGSVLYDNTEGAAALDSFSVSVVSEDNSWSGIVNIPILVDPMVSTELQVEKRPLLKLFPNPVTNILNIEKASEFNWKKFRVYNNTGQLIYAEDLQPYSMSFSILTGSWIPGVYFTVVEIENGQLISKMINVQ
ncbi:reprolysin-like metallopeptidase [Membranihabitans maritimus]|uniref:reprolysin-like metallopeptidase n=1 Tax=Membranihabitans maritimus TaxID=2904244 RepID=UPI001F20D3CA|nr:M12 family metallo-peptidase [Membranihabitans maritimus]